MYLAKLFLQILRLLFKSIFFIILVLLAIVNIVYLSSKVYDFSEDTTFSGSYIYNPYQNIEGLESFRANFHAHSIAWKGITDGRDTEEAVYEAYVKEGYDVPGLSNYHHISTFGKDKEAVYIPVYEHGYNMKKSHLLAIDAQKVSFYDFLFWQTTSHKQQIIDHLKESTAVIAIAHPKYWGSRTFSDMRQLVNYDLTEILNHNKESEEYWDEGLSAGKLTWCLGDDDTHGLNKEPTFMRWNMIYSNKRDKKYILEALKNGQHYSVLSPGNLLKASMVSCLMTDSMTFEVVVSEKVNEIVFIGQNGEIRQQTGTTNRASYTFKPEDTYIRTVVHHQDGKIYLNPLMRFDGDNLPLNSLNQAPINFMKTWGLRALFLLPLLFLFFLVRWTIQF